MLYSSSDTMSNNYTKFIFSTLLILFSAHSLFAQEYEDEFNFDKVREKEEAIEEELEKDDKFFDKERLYFGGGFGFAFGNIVFLDISPDVIYEVIEDRMQVGAGISYQYTNYRGDMYQYPGGNKFHSYGARLFDRVFIWDGLFAQLEYQMVNTEYLYSDGVSGIIRSRGTFHTMFGGLGYNFMVGRNSFMSMTMLVNLNTNDYYPIRRPYFNMGFGIGF